MRIWRRTLRRVLLTRRTSTVALIVASFAVLGGLVIPGPVSATPLVNDYPTYLRAQPRDALVDPWYFYSRECTSFVAWRLTNDNHLPFSNSWGGVHWGNAYQWATAARALGFPVNSTPSVGAVAWWNAGSASSRLGHVAWVARVYSDHSVLIEEYNYVSPGAYSQRHLYPGTYTWPSAFLHLGDLKMVNTTAPKVLGTPTVGVAVTASPGSWRPVGLVNFAYSWYANGVAITGANSQKYTPTPGQLGQKLTVKVTASMGGVKPASLTSIASPAVAAGTLVASGTPVVVGTPQVGVPLVAEGATWRPAPAVTYQWYSNGVAIPGATDPTYVPRPADLGATITVTATATARGYKTAAATVRSAAGVKPGVFANSKIPTVVGGTAATVGTPLTALPGSWTPSATYSYEWWTASPRAPIPGANAAAFVPTPDLVGKQVFVKVTASTPGYSARTVSSMATTLVIPGSFSAPPLTALQTPAVGAPLTVDPGTITGTTTPTITYQWYLNGVAIRGATLPTYTPQPSQLGRRLSVTVKASAPGYYTLTRTTPMSQAVQLGTLHVVTQPTMTADPHYGAAVRYTPAQWSARTSSVTYQWYANGSAIRGATGLVYTPTLAVVGKSLSVIERVTSVGYHNASTRTFATTITRGGTARLTSAPALTGTALVGSTLTLTAGAPFPSDAQRTVHWFRDGVAFQNATPWSYLIRSTDIGHRISAQVTVSRALWTSTDYAPIQTHPVVSPGTMAASVTRVSSTRVHVSVTIKAPGVSNPAGVVQVIVGGRVVATGSVVNGRASFYAPVSTKYRTVNLVYSRDPRIRVIHKNYVTIR